MSEEHQIVDALPESYWGLSELERLRGNFNEAFHWLRESTRLRNETPDSPVYQLGMGAIYLDMGQGALAQPALESAVQTWKTLARPRQEQVRAEFLLAQACYEGGQQPQALEWLARALQHAAVLGYDQFLVSAGRRTPHLLDYANRVWPKNTQLQSLMQRIESFSPKLASLQETPPVAETRRAARLELFAFGAGAVRWRSGAQCVVAFQAGPLVVLLYCREEAGDQRRNRPHLLARLYSREGYQQLPRHHVAVAPGSGAGHPGV
jgi:hypothetical protein